MRGGGLAVAFVDDSFFFLFFSFIAIDLVKRLLTVDVKQRISIDDALKHPFLQVCVCVCVCVVAMHAQYSIHAVLHCVV